MAHLGLTRRAFLRTSAAAMGASALSSGVLAQSARFRRWEISDPNMPTTVLASYKKAIGEMLKLPPTDPRNWYRNAFVHVLDCPHGNWWFLPWHRAYLGWLERTCRELSGDQTFALPYWDWTKSPRVPAAMFADVLDPNNSQFIATFDEFKPKFEAPVAALYASFSQAQKDALARRPFPVATPADLLAVVGEFFFFDQPDARGLAAASPDLDDDTKTTVAIDMITDALLTPSFAGSASGTDAAGFASAQAADHSGQSRSGILESQPHNNVHGAIGGPNGRAFMVSMMSPVDPIFFLHHGNLDRLWDVWSRRQAAQGRPTLPQGADLTAWSDEQFLFFSDERGQPVTKIKSGGYAAMSAFDYDYSAGSGEDQVQAPAIVALPAIPTQSFSASISSRSLEAGAAARGVAEVPAAALRAAAPAAPPPVAEITLNLSAADQGRRFRVQVTPAGGGSPITAGTITVFGEHGHHGPATFTVPLPKAAAAAAAAPGANVPLNISVVPIGPTGGLPLRAGPAAAAPSAASQPELAAIRVLTN